MGRDGIKRRIYDEIVVNGIRLHSLFDTGAQNSYITKEAVRRCRLASQKLRVPFPTGLGGQRRIIKEGVTMDATLRGLPFHLHVFVVDELGRDHERRAIDFLFGILAMEQWGVEPDVRRKRLDLRHFTKEFIEFSSS